jgi:hypothetical protein
MSKDETPCGTTRMGTVYLIVKRTLLGLIGIMVVSAICFSSIMPSSLRLVELEDGTRVPAAKPVSAHSVAAGHARRTKALKGLQPKSSDSKTSTDRKAAQTAHALARCKNFTPADGAPDVLGETDTAREIYKNSNKEKNLCNAESLRSR